jgi:hypothetical protein
MPGAYISTDVVEIKYNLVTVRVPDVGLPDDGIRANGKLLYLWNTSYEAELCPMADCGITDI